MRMRSVMAMACLLLGGCADPQLEELDRRLAEIRDNPGASQTLSMPEVPVYEIVPYQASGRRSPFQAQLPQPARSPASNSGLTPDPERPREALETYDLQSLALVGILTMSGQTHALVRSPTGEVHRLRTGNYLGQNHGRIVSITDSTVQLVELVATGSGWTERTATLSLNEARR